MNSKTFRTIVSVAVASVAVSFAAPQLHAQVTPSLVTNRLTQPVDENSRVTLRGTVSPLANAANDRGAAPDSMPLDHIQVVLKRSSAQEAALKQLIRQQNTPGSPNYHKWLTPAQFGAQFGPSDQDIATLQAWFQSQGFNIQKVAPGKQMMVISGNAAQFRNAFHTSIHKYLVNGEIHYANAANPQVPTALAPVFGGFASLNNFRPHSYAHVLGHASYDPKTGQATPQWTYGNSSGVSLVVAPGDFAKEYDLPTTLDGTGQTIAVINESNIDVSLVNSFRTLFGLPANPPQVILAGNDPGIDGINEPDGANYASGEAYLDVEWAGAVAPKATVDLVIAGDTALESGLILAAEHVVYNNLASVMSVSFGACERDLGSSNAFLNDLYEQAAAEGITVVVASGDSGSAGCDNDNTQQYAVNGLAVSGYASTPYDVAVGGTDFFYSDYNQSSSTLNNQLAGYWNLSASQNPSTSIQQYIPEQPWNDSQYGLNAVDYYTATNQTSIASGGGGASSCITGTVNTSTGTFSACTAGYAKPAWQSGAGVPADNVRDIPDVSLFAAAGLNYSYYATCSADGDCQPASGSNLIQITGVGGTSASAPAFAGIMALVNQKYGRQGQADNVLYPLAAQFPAAFHDVTTGTNTVPCNTTAVTDSNTGTVIQPLDCIAAPGTAISVKDSTYGQATEGELGTGTTADYNAAAGYDLATGLGSVDATQLINDWANVKFAASAVTLTSPAPGASFTHGQSVTFTGTVTGTSPTGNVAIETNNAESGQAALGLPSVLSGSPSVFTLSNGSFSGSLSTLPGGTYNVWASYGGDTKNAAAQSTPFQITVSPEASGIAFNLLTPNSNSSGYGVMASGTGSIPYGQQILLSAVVAPSAQVSAYQSCLTGASKTCPSFTIPTGSVTFTDGSSTYVAPINDEGEAEFNSATTFSVGSHSISASYSGDNSYNPSTASAQSFTVVKATPSIFITGATNQQGQIVVQQGQSLTLTLLVEGYGTGIAPTGTLSISGGPTGTPTSATLSPTVDPFYGTTAGMATITIPTSASASGSVAHQNQKTLPPWVPGTGAALACVLLIGIPSRRKSWRGIVGLVVITLFTISVSIGCGSSGGSGSGSGGGFGGGGGTGGSGGTSTGSYTINVSFAGDANYNSASGSATFSVTTASTLLTSTTNVTSTGTSPNITSAVGVTVTVNGVTGHPAPTGTVVLYTGSLSSSNSSQGTAVELTQGKLTAGSGATSTVSFTFDSESLLQGANDLTVLYEGDNTYAMSSTTLNLSNPLSDFSVTPASSNVSLSASGSGTDVLTAAAANGFTGTVSLTCTPAAGTAVTCSLSPSSVSLNGTGNTSTSTLTVNGNGAAAGNYQVLVTATSGTTVHTMAVTAAVR